MMFSGHMASVARVNSIGLKVPASVLDSASKVIR